jgi:hypothetical protein
MKVAVDALGSVREPYLQVRHEQISDGHPGKQAAHLVRIQQQA